jgi:hypothetical protein
MLTRIETISTQVVLEKVKPSLFWSLLFAYFVHSLKSFHENANLKKMTKFSTPFTLSKYNNKIWQSENRIYYYY